MSHCGFFQGFLGALGVEGRFGLGGVVLQLPRLRGRLPEEEPCDPEEPEDSEGPEGEGSVDIGSEMLAVEPNSSWP